MVVARGSNPTIRVRSSSSFAIVMFVAVLMSGVTNHDCIAQPINNTPKAEQPNSSEPDQLILGLRDDSYEARELAAFQLLRMGDKAIPALEKAAHTGDIDLAHNAIRLLGELAQDPNKPPGSDALASLRRLQNNPFSVSGNLSKRVLDAVEFQQSELAKLELQQIGVEIGILEFQILLKASDLHIGMKIGETFRGKLKDLDRMQWLRDMEYVEVRGGAINGEILPNISKLNGLQQLKLTEIHLEPKDLLELRTTKRLEVLDLVYVNISDDWIDTMASLPITGTLRLFGTQVSEEGAEKLRSMMPDIEIVYGKGGFLGVSVLTSSTGTGVSIRTITSGGAAETAGLFPGDTIHSINNVPLKKFEDLRKELSHFGPGEKVEIVFERAGNRETISVPLGKQR